MNVEQNRSGVDRLVSVVDPIHPLSAYPVEMLSFHALAHYSLDEAGVPYRKRPTEYQPAIITQYALSQWNLFLVNELDEHRLSFIAQATWLVKHVVRVGTNACGWPIADASSLSPVSDVYLSAQVQGCVLSVLVRAYRLTHNTIFLTTAHYAARTFLLDILDGGVCAPVGENGIFFEEAAVYPALHALSGCLFALIGLYDYNALVGEASIKSRIEQCLRTLHTLLPAFDTGYWVYLDATKQTLSSPEHLSLQVKLLEALAKYAASASLSSAADHWNAYLTHFRTRFHYQFSYRCSLLKRRPLHMLRTACFPPTRATSRTHVCISARGTLNIAHDTFLQDVITLMGDGWDIEFLAQSFGATPSHHTVHRFGNTYMKPRYFPSLWLYVLCGFVKQLALLLGRKKYHILLPQDALFTGVFAGLAGKIAGVRVVCIDHGELGLFAPGKMQAYRAECSAALARKVRPVPLLWLAEAMLALYFPSLLLLARLSALCIDHFLMLGEGGENVEEGCRAIGIPYERITYYQEEFDAYDAPVQLKRVLQRATYWSGLSELLSTMHKAETIEAEEGDQP